MYEVRPGLNSCKISAKDLVEKTRAIGRVSANARTPLRRSAVASAARVVWIATSAGIVFRDRQGKARRSLHLQIGDIQVANKRTRTQSVEYASVQ